MFTIRVLAVLCICQLGVSQVSHKEACKKFSPAIVEIEAGGSSLGTGFLVSPDGWIFTAAHILFDLETGTEYATVSVKLSSGSSRLATYVSPADSTMAGRDYAFLKIEGANLPYLDIGENAEEVVLGSDITIIGFPFSAIAFKQSEPSVKEKFCLSGAVAASGQANIPVTFKKGATIATVNVNVDVVYFQGPSVKGLSGSPLISRDTGRVIGILTSKLSGINRSLSDAKQALLIGKQSGEYIIDNVPMEGLNIAMIDTLDTQLANGLGAATGIEDAKFAFRHVLREHKRSKPKKGND